MSQQKMTEMFQRKKPRVACGKLTAYGKLKWHKSIAASTKPQKLIALLRSSTTHNSQSKQGQFIFL